MGETIGLDSCQTGYDGVCTEEGSEHDCNRIARRGLADDVYN
jgi:hypothetical protein